MKNLSKLALKAQLTHNHLKLSTLNPEHVALPLHVAAILALK